MYLTVNTLLWTLPFGTWDQLITDQTNVFLAPFSAFLWAPRWNRGAWYVLSTCDIGSLLWSNSTGWRKSNQNHQNHSSLKKRKETRGVVECFFLHFFRALTAYLALYKRKEHNQGFSICSRVRLHYHEMFRKGGGGKEYRHLLVVTLWFIAVVSAMHLGLFLVFSHSASKW